MATITADAVTVPAGTAFARMGRSVAAGNAPQQAPAQGIHRANQPLLFQPTDVAARASTIGGGAWGLDANERRGPNATYVSVKTGWPWPNYGGSWIDGSQAHTAQGSVPWATHPLNAVAGEFAAHTYTGIDITALALYVQTNGTWMALFVRSNGGARSLATPHTGGAHHSVTYNYVDGTNETVPATVVAYASEPIGPNTSGAYLPMPCFVEFQRPQRAVVSATMALRVVAHWSGNSTLELMLLRPSINTDPYTAGAGLAQQGGVADVGLSAVPGVIGSHRYEDGAPESQFLVRQALNKYSESNYSPSVITEGGAVDTSKWPYTTAGKWLVPANGGTVELVTGAQMQAAGVTPLAPGLGALKCTMLDSGIANGGAADSNGTLGVDLQWFLPPEHFGLLDHGFVRYYIWVAAPADPQPSDRREFMQGTNRVWAQMSGKWGINFSADNSYGGFSRTSGGPYGFQLRSGYYDATPGAAGPDRAGFAAGHHFTDDFQGNQPVGYRYGVNGDAGNLEMNHQKEMWGQRGGRGGVIYSGRWVMVEHELAANTASTAGTWSPDGVLRTWVDGCLVFEKTNLVVRTLPRAVIAYDGSKLRPAKNLGFTKLLLNWFHGGTTPNTVNRAHYYAAVAFGTSRIGAMKTGAATPLNISGNTWTPNRDGMGVVLDSDLQSFPVASSKLIAGTTLASVMEKPKRFGNQGHDSELGMLDAWSGGVFIKSQKRIVMKGGGHRATAAHDNPIIGFDLLKMAPYVHKARTTDANLQDWNPATSQLQAGFDGGSSQSAPCLDGAPTATHTFSGLEYIPGNLYGNTNGAIFVPGNAMAFLDMDTNAYSVTYWNPPPDGSRSWSKMVNIVSGGELLSVKESPTQLERINYNQTTVTAWSTISGQGPSKGAIDRAWQGVATFSRYDFSVIIKLPELGLLVSLCSTAGYGNKRLRIADAQAAGLANGGSMAPYIDVITLTSADGSHLELQDLERQRDFGGAAGFIDGVTGDMHCPGVVHDTARNCVWIWGNQVGGMVYKLTGINTTSWTVEKIPGTASLQANVGVTFAKEGHGSFGRLGLWESGSAFGLVRVDKVDDLAQIVRLG